MWADYRKIVEPHYPSYPQIFFLFPFPYGGAPFRPGKNS